MNATGKEKSAFCCMIRELGILLTVTLIIALCANSVSPKGIPFFGQWDVSKGGISPKEISFDIEIKTIDEAKAVFDQHQAVFVDARSDDAYREGHIEGAVSLPVYLFDEQFEQFQALYPTNTYIVTYCSGRECRDSHELAELFEINGYGNVRVFIDGYPLWEAEGLPIAYEK